jgi:EmrB/QacA subfamily drug resistance transporter
VTTTTRAPAGAPPPAPQKSPAGRRWLGLFAVLAAVVMNLLDGTITNVATPSIRADLGGSYATLQWIAAAYILAMAVGLLTGGRLGDMYGRRRMLLIGVTGFVAASTACALAWSPESLIAARAVQGLFAAVMVPQCFGLVRDLFPPDKVGQAFAMFGPVIGLSTIAGPVVGGLLIDADLAGTGWRAIFLINLPLGVFALVAGRRVLPAPAPTARAAGLDLTGVLLGGLGAVMLVYPLVQGRELGWPAWSLAVFAGAVPVMAVFVAHQARRRRTGRAPLVELSVFSKRSYSAGVLFIIAFFGACVGVGLVLGLFLQLGLGYSAQRASLTMAALAVGAFIGSGIGSTVGARLGRVVLHTGLAVMAAGTAAVYLVLVQVGTDLGGWHLAGPLLLYGLGMGMIFAPLFDIIMAGVADHEVGSASGMLETFQGLGASLGIAVLGTLFFAVFGSQADPRGAVDAAARTTLLALGLTALAFLLGFLLPRRARPAAAGP